MFAFLKVIFMSSFHNKKSQKNTEKSKLSLTYTLIFDDNQFITLVKGR